jgi:hypothetical protein
MIQFANVIHLKSKIKIIEDAFVKNTMKWNHWNSLIKFITKYVVYLKKLIKITKIAIVAKCNTKTLIFVNAQKSKKKITKIWIVTV